MTACKEAFLCGVDIDAFLAIFRSYICGAKDSEVVENRQKMKTMKMKKKITTYIPCALYFTQPQHINCSRRDALY